MAKTPEVGPQLTEETPETRKQVQVSLLWGDTVLDVRHLSEPGRMSVGRDLASDFRIDVSAIGDGFDLVEWRGSECEVVVPPGAKLLIGPDGGALEESLAPVRRVAIGAGQRARIGLGGLAFEVRWAVAPKERGVAVPRDYRFARTVTISCMTAVAVFAAILVTDVKVEVLSEDISRSLPMAIVMSRVKPPERVIELPKPKVIPHEDERPTGVSTRFGGPTDKHGKNRVAVADLVKGIFGNSGAVSEVFNSGGMSDNLNNALGALKEGPGSVASAGGFGDVGSRRLGPGGGPAGLGITGIGMGNGGAGGGRNWNIKIGDGRRKTEVKLPQNTQVIGGCERSVIAQVIGKNAHQIRSCYEIELGRDNSLEGKVAVTFTIGADGSVVQADVAQSTLGSAGAEACMLKRVRGWKFPAPTGGGICVINYPWVFKTAGSDGD